MSATNSLPLSLKTSPRVAGHMIWNTQPHDLEPKKELYKTL